MRIAVTGAAGFVGAAVAAAARERGWTVHALTRRDWDVTTGPLPRPPAVDAVVHAAALVHDRRDPGPAWRANLDGTRHVAASFPGVRLVHVSTASVYDPFTPTVDATEDTAPVGRYLTPYAASKAAAERLLAGRPGTVVLRPHAVYGPGDPHLLPRILAAVRISPRSAGVPGTGRRRGTLVVAGRGDTLHTLTALGTLVTATLRACDPAVRAGVYNVGDAEPVTLDGALRAFFAERGLDVRLRHLPLRPAWVLAGGVERAAAVARRPPPRLTRYAVSHLGVQRTLDLSAAREHLGLDPAPTSFAGAGRWTFGRHHPDGR